MIAVCYHSCNHPHWAIIVGFARAETPRRRGVVEGRHGVAVAPPPSHTARKGEIPASASGWQHICLTNRSRFVVRKSRILRASAPLRLPCLPGRNRSIGDHRRPWPSSPRPLRLGGSARGPPSMHAHLSALTPATPVFPWLTLWVKTTRITTIPNGFGNQRLRHERDRVSRRPGWVRDLAGVQRPWIPHRGSSRGRGAGRRLGRPAGRDRRRTVGTPRIAPEGSDPTHHAQPNAVLRGREAGSRLGRRAGWPRRRTCRTPRTPARAATQPAARSAP